MNNLLVNNVRFCLQNAKNYGRNKPKRSKIEVGGNLKMKL